MPKLVLRIKSTDTGTCVISFDWYKADYISGAYYQKHMLKSDNSRKSIVIEQGQDIGKDGIIKVELPIKEEDAIKIYGTAVFVKEFFVKELST